VSPTARTLKALRDGGATCQVVEHWNSFAKIRQDLFGCIDVLVLLPDEAEAAMKEWRRQSPNIKLRVRKYVREEKAK